MARTKTKFPFTDHIDLNLSILILISVALILALSSLVFGQGLLQASAVGAVPQTKTVITNQKSGKQVKPVVSRKPSPRPASSISY